MDEKALFLKFWDKEATATRKVISRIPQATSDHRADPKARTAREIAWLMVREEIMLAAGLLSGTLAYFDLTKQNITTADPLFPTDDLHGLAIGEANSHGVELDLAGEIVPGWQMIANYAYTETEILDDTVLGAAGNRLPNVPRHV